mmetsp:Transcript_24549/g.92761  ORF Transcript_24549/g.92761 Transcript_24549/m.92761 type:complete len:204 (+) Transcript_24549:768-1379(+)
MPRSMAGGTIAIAAFMSLDVRCFAGASLPRGSRVGPQRWQSRRAAVCPEPNIRGCRAAAGSSPLAPVAAMASAGAAAPLYRVVKLMPRSHAVRFFRRDGDDCFTVFERDAFDIADLVRPRGRSRLETWGARIEYRGASGLAPPAAAVPPHLPSPPFALSLPAAGVQDANRGAAGGQRQPGGAHSVPQSIFHGGFGVGGSATVP